MPNWVNSRVEMELQNSDVKLLEAMKENGGICRTYNPMPALLNKTVSPPQIVSVKEYKEQQKFNEEYLQSIPEGQSPDDWKIKKGITKKMHEEFIKNYGCADWYSWASKHWGTKWGDCDFDYWEDETTDNGTTIVVIHWESAWGPILHSLTEKLINDLRATDTTAKFNWEEEQGYGEEYELVDGKLSLISQWDLPEWGDDYYEDDKGNCYTYLVEDYFKMGEVYSKGFYLEHSIHEPYDKETHGEIKKMKW